MRRYSAPSRKTGKEITGFIESSFGQYREDVVGGTIKASGGVAAGGSETFITQPIALAENTIGRQPHNGGNGNGFTEGGPMYTLNATGVHGVAKPIVVHGTQDPCVSDIAFAQGRNNGGENVVFAPADVGPSMGASGPPYSRTGNERVEADALAIHNMEVRRLTTKECERLQGFPDNYTDIRLNNKDTPDGPRYKALGNSMAVPVMAWIGKRIQEVENS